MLIFNVVFDNDFHCLLFIIFFRLHFFKILLILVLKLFFFIFLYFLICQQILFNFILLIFIAILFFSLFSILIACIFRFFPFFIHFPSKTYIFYYDNAAPPYYGAISYFVYSGTILHSIAQLVETHMYNRNTSSNLPKLYSLLGYRCRLVPRLPFPVPSFPFSDFPFPVQKQRTGSCRGFSH